MEQQSAGLQREAQQQTRARAAAQARSLQLVWWLAVGDPAGRVSGRMWSPPGALQRGQRRRRNLG